MSAAAAAIRTSWRPSRGDAGQPTGVRAVIGFDYVKARDVSDAISQIARDPNARFIAGGSNLIDLM